MNVPAKAELTDAQALLRRLVTHPPAYAQWRVLRISGRGFGGFAFKLLASVMTLTIPIVDSAVTATAAAAAAPAVSVEPSTGLTNGQTVKVTYTGFQPGYTVLLRQCSPEPSNGDDCDFLSLLTSLTDEAGGGQIEFTVRALPAPEFASSVACDPENECWLVVSEDLNDLSQPFAAAPIAVREFPAAGPSEAPATAPATEERSRPFPTILAVISVGVLGFVIRRFRKNRRPDRVDADNGTSR